MTREKKQPEPVVAETPVAPAAKTPIHLWTHDSDKVLIVKCVEVGGKSYGGFQWPKSGPVKPAKCSTQDDCDSGGLFGWAWGLNLGGGKDPDYASDWIVFAVDPRQVILLDDKIKVAAATPDDVRADVVYYGSWAGSLEFTLAGRLAWINHFTKDALASATGWRGAASATGGRGAASATGGSGAASATGESGAASATGWSGAASATGERGAASATGERGAASATGLSGAASATGLSGAASATGERGAASATGWSGAASATGERGAASATGESGAASATGLSGGASATGWRGIASLSGKLGQIEVGPHALGAVTANEWYWVVNKGSVVACRWSVDDVWHHRLLLGDDQDVEDGTIIKVVDGQPQTEAASS